MKKSLRYLLIGGLIVVLLGILIWQKTGTFTNGERKGPSITLYWGNTCPHCHTLMSGEVYKEAISKLNLTTKEVWQSAKNADEMQANIANCNLAQDSAGVPLLYVSEPSSCYIGVPSIEEVFTAIMNDSPLPSTTTDLPETEPSDLATPEATTL